MSVVTRIRGTEKGISTMPKLTVFFIALALFISITSFINAEEEPDIDNEQISPGSCEMIEESPDSEDDDFFRFHQHDARLDPNQFVKVVYKVGR